MFQDSRRCDPELVASRLDGVVSGLGVLPPGVAEAFGGGPELLLFLATALAFRDVGFDRYDFVDVAGMENEGAEKLRRLVVPHVSREFGASVSFGPGSGDSPALEPSPGRCS